MPRSEWLVAMCIQLADYDLQCSLETIISQPPEGRLHGAIVTLIRRIPEPGKNGLRHPEFSDKELEQITLTDVALHMLDYTNAYISDTDIGSYFLYEQKGKQPTETDSKLRKIFSCADAHDPMKLQKMLYGLQVEP